MGARKIHVIPLNPRHVPPRSVLHPCLPARFKSAIPPWSISIFQNQSPQPRESASGEGWRPVEMGVYSYFLIQGSSVSAADPSLRYLCPCPTALSNPGCAFHGFSVLLPPCLAPCFQLQKPASLLLPRTAGLLRLSSIHPVAS